MTEFIQPMLAHELEDDALLDSPRYVAEIVVPSVIRGFGIEML